MLIDEHIKRLKTHCNKLSIEYPPNVKEKFAIACESLTKLENNAKYHSSQPPFLLRFSLSSSGAIDVKGRKNRPHNGKLTATISEAPRWSGEITGTKHADWSKYLRITKNAEELGFDIALLIFNETIVDADRSTPILLDHDGIAWVCDNKMGGVDSITLDYVENVLETHGIPLMRGRLTATMLLRSEELLVLGTGVGVAKVIEVDGTKIGNDSNILYNIICETLTKLQTEKWIEIGD